LVAGRAYALLSRQLEALEDLGGLDYRVGKPREKEWEQLTEKLILRAFGSDSVNLANFRRAGRAGDYSFAIVPYGRGPAINHGKNQSNYQARIHAYGGCLRSCLAELRIDIPDAEIKGTYAPGDEYDFYRDVKHVVGLAQADLLVVDPYINTEMFALYVKSPSAVSHRLLTTNTPQDVIIVARKFSTCGSFQLRETPLIHDRVIFADHRVWVIGQSLKDAAKKKPTYLVEHEEALMRQVYERIWSEALPII
jgi:hypothetical protein